MKRRSVIGRVLHGTVAGLVFLVISMSAALALGQSSGKLLAPNGATDGNFGISVALSGDTAIIGASENGVGTGRAYVFVRQDAGWAVQQELVALDAAAGDDFGWWVALSGDTAVVGAPGDDDLGASSGSAYVFVRSGTAWTFQQKLTAPDGAESDWFGDTVAIDGDTIAVTADGDDDLGSQSGSAYVFVRSGGSWSIQEKLTAADGAPEDMFGWPVTVSGDIIAVGAPRDDDRGDGSGSVYVFARSGPDWSQQQKLTATDGAAGDHFADCIDLDGGTLVVGADGDDDQGDDSGSAYVFTRTDTTWTERQKLVALGGAAGDRFGYPVAIDGLTTVVGAEWDDDRGGGSGSAYVFSRGVSGWAQIRKLFAPDGAEHDNFGYALDVDGESAMVGAKYDDDLGDGSGSAYYFALNRTAIVEDQEAGVTFDRWVTGFSGAYSGGTYVYGRWTNTELQAKFTGSEIRWVGPKQPSYGKADVYIDGVYKATIDCYVPVAQASISTNVWECSELADGPHTIRVRLTGAKNAASSGNVVVIDRFEIDGVAPSGAGSRWDELGFRTTFTGTWIKALNPTYYESTYAYSRWPGTTYAVGFTGTKVAWIGPMTTSYGKANVYIDGAYKGTIDCYNPATGWRYKIWESEELTRERHYIQIRPTGTKRAASTNTVVVVDAFDVTP